ncbi:hypothetical protein ABZ203_13305, partial [Streptomyces albidoflavus]
MHHGGQRALLGNRVEESGQRGPVGEVAGGEGDLGAVGAYSTAITDVFLYAAPVVLVAFVLAWFFHED